MYICECFIITTSLIQFLHLIHIHIFSEQSDENTQRSQPAPVCNGCESGGRPEEHMSSCEWLQKHGIKAQHLDIYDVMASVSFKHCDGVVDVLRPPNDIRQNPCKLTTYASVNEITSDNVVPEQDPISISQTWTPGAVGFIVFSFMLNHSQCWVSNSFLSFCVFKIL